MNHLSSLIPSANTPKGGHRSRGDLLLTVEAGVALGLTILLLIVSFAFAWPDLPLRNDFVAFWTAGWMARDGAGPAFFDMERQRAIQTALRQAATTTEAVRSATSYAPFLNPPPLALVFVPLTVLPAQGAFVIWFALNLTAFVVSVAVHLHGASNGRGRAVMLLTFGGVTLTLLEGQVDAIFLLALSLALLAFCRDRPAMGGALLGVMWLEFQYVGPFVLLFLVKRRWRELSGMASAGAVAGALTLAMIGPSGILNYLKQMHRIGTFRPPADVLVSPLMMINWRAILLNLWPDIPDGAGAALVLLLGAATILVALVAWRGDWDPGSPGFARQMLVLTLATILASPHSHFHVAVLLLAPLAALLARSPAGVAPVKGWRPLLVGGLFLSVILVPLPPQRWLLGPYLLIALGMLLLGRPVSANKAPTSNVGVGSTPAS